MTPQPVSPPDPARLDELAAVTQEYARYSRTAYGGAFVVTGAGVLVTVAADVFGHWGFARFVYLLLPAVWLLLLAGSRAYYQRHGTVVEPAQRVAGRGWILAVVYFTCASMLIYLGGRGLRWVLDAGAGELGWTHVLGAILAISGVVAVPLLTAEVVRGKLDAAVTISIVALALTAATWPPFPARSLSELASLNEAISVIRALLLIVASLAAVFMLVAGAREHVRYRVLERRLAALKRRA